MTSSPAKTSMGRAPLYKKIERELRDSIASGELPYGTRLPNILDLARQHGASVCTIQNALGKLAKDGLIERSRSRGTFVTAGSTKLSNVGIYFGSSLLHGQEMAYCRVLHRKLAENIARRGGKHWLWADSRPDNESATPLPELLAAVSQRRLQGLMVGVANGLEENWLERLQIPLSVFSWAKLPSRVDLDHAQMMRDGLADLKRQGCHLIGAIFPSPADEYNDALQAFTDTIADLGLRTKDSWVRLPGTHMDSKDYERFGYDQFQELWKQPQRPDGLLIYPDVIVRGTVTAMLQAGVSVPGDLKLVLHRNEGVPLLCPLAASWVETDLTAVAASLISQLEKQLAGQPVEPVSIPYSFTHI